MRSITSERNSGSFSSAEVLIGRLDRELVPTVGQPLLAVEYTVKTNLKHWIRLGFLAAGCRRPLGKLTGKAAVDQGFPLL
jgi:hypothetical protein